MIQSKDYLDNGSFQLPSVIDNVVLRALNEELCVCFTPSRVGVAMRVHACYLCHHCFVANEYLCSLLHYVDNYSHVNIYHDEEWY